jgi:hypothetical protein
VIEDSEAMEAFVQARGCRRAAISRYIDGVPVQCSELVEVAAPTAVVVCNNCDTYASTTEQAQLYSRQIA